MTVAAVKRSPAEVEYTISRVQAGQTPTRVTKEINDLFGVNRTVYATKAFLRSKAIRWKDFKHLTPPPPPKEIEEPAEDTTWRETRQRDTWIIEARDSRICTVDDAIAKAGADMDIWQVDKIYASGWDVTMKIRKGDEDEPFRAQNQSIKVVLKRKVPESVEDAVKGLLTRLADASTVVPKIRIGKKTKPSKRNSFELCLADLHYGMRCFAPAADSDYSPEICQGLIEDTISEFLIRSAMYGPFEEIVLPVGNDFFHIDNVFHTTTAGTGQPEADSYLHTFLTGEELVIAMIDTLKQLAPVKVYAIPGNHDRVTSFMLGRILKSYYHADKNVTVHADSSPYKMHRFGTNMWAYEHGHSVAAIRLAAIMANQWPVDFAETKFRSWHLGDQHRRGSAKPSMLEEQGVSIEYLPSIVANNEWHKIKGFTHQQRGSVAYVWNYVSGPVAKLYVNIDNETNKVLKGE